MNNYCNGIIHTIRRGDTLYSLSRQYNVPLVMILRANPYVDVYNLEMIIAIAFRICSRESIRFRQFVMNEICATKKGSPVTLFVSYGKNGNLWYS